MGALFATIVWGFLARGRGISILLFVALQGTASAVAAPAPGQSASAREHARRGAQLAQAGDLRAAEVELRRAVELEPDNALYLSQLARALALQNRIAEAGRYLKRAVQLDPGKLMIRRQLALTQWHQGNLEEAEKNLEMIARVSPEDALIHLLLGMVAQRRGDHSRAIRLLESVGDLLFERSDAVVALMQAYYASGEREKGRRMGKMLVSAKLENPEHLFLAARTARAADDYETARQLLVQLRPHHPDPVALDYELGLVHHQTGAFEKCTQLLGEVIEKGRSPGAIYNLMGHCRQGRKQIKEAIEAFQKAIDLEPLVEDYYLDLIRLLGDRGIWRVAIRVAERGVKQLPSSHRLYEVKGLSESMMFDVERSMQSFRRALEINPDSERALRGLAVGLGAAGQIKEAKELFEQGIRRFPSDALNYQEYGLLLLKTVESGDEEALPRAVQLLKKALELNEMLFEPHYQLGKWALAKGETDKALSRLERAVKISLKRQRPTMHWPEPTVVPDERKKPPSIFRSMLELRRLEEKSIGTCAKISVRSAGADDSGAASPQTELAEENQPQSGLWPYGSTRRNLCNREKVGSGERFPLPK